ncbi:MAG: hypothetical protein V3V01_02215 [Acidimicrobiales bacterium]
MVQIDNVLKPLTAAVALALVGISLAVAIAPSASAQAGIGCGTSTLEHTELLDGVTLVGNAGRRNAVETIVLPAPLAPGEYLIRAVSSDDHATETIDEPQEQFYAAIARQRTEPIADLPLDAGFVGSSLAEINPDDPERIPAEVLPGASLGVIQVAGGETELNLVHVGRGKARQANSISPRLVSIACAVTGLDLSFASADSVVAADGSATVGLVVTNTNDSAVKGVKLQASLPAGLERNGDLSASTGVISAIGSSIRWEGDLDAGSSVQIEVPIVTDLDGITNCGQGTEALVGVCEMTAQLVGVSGGVPATPIASAHIVAPADLELAMSYQPRVGTASSLTGTFTVIIKNQPGSHLSSTAHDVVVSTSLDDLLALAPGDLASTSGTVIIENGEISWTVGSLLPGATSTLSFGIALPSVGSFSAESRVASSATIDLDSVAGPSSTSAEDDEASAVAIGEFAPTTTTTPQTTTTSVATAPSASSGGDSETAPTGDDADNGSGEGFRLILPDGVDTSPPEASDPESVEDQTEVAGAVEERPETAATIPIRSQSKLPLALSIAFSLLLLSAAAVYMYRTQQAELNSFH